MPGTSFPAPLGHPDGRAHRRRRRKLGEHGFDVVARGASPPQSLHDLAEGPGVLVNVEPVLDSDLEVHGASFSVIRQDEIFQHDRPAGFAFSVVAGFACVQIAENAFLFLARGVEKAAVGVKNVRFAVYDAGYSGPWALFAAFSRLARS